MDDEQKFLFFQPKWRGRKVVRHFVAALTIGSISLSLSCVYTKTDQGWTRESVIKQQTRTGHDYVIAAVLVFLTSGSTWLVPADFGILTSVECLSAGSSGNATGTSGSKSAGGGAAYTKITTTSTTLTPGVTVINVGIGLGGAGVTGTTTSNAGGDTWWNATSLANAVTLGSAVCCAAQGAQAATSAAGGPGGLASASVGTTKFDGGTGSHGATANGGGGAAGPNGAGSAGTSTNGGNADNGTVVGPTTTNAGNSGTEFDGTHGCGTGAFTSISTGNRAGGLYGGGGTAVASASTSGAGANGLIVVTYTLQYVVWQRQRQYLRR